MDQIKLLIVAHSFPPTLHSGVFRTAAFAKYLPSFGILPYVFTATDDDKSVLGYSSPPDEVKEYRPRTKRVAWNLYDSPLRNGLVRNFAMRVPGLAAVYRSVCWSRLLTEISPQLEDFAKDSSADAIYATSAPHQALLLAYSLSRQTGLPLLCDLRDPWVYYSGACYRSPLEFLLEKRTERKVLRASKSIIVNTRASRRLLLEVYDVAPEKVVVIPNGYDEEDFCEARFGYHLDRHHFNVVYTGLLSPFTGEARNFRRRIKSALLIDYRPMREVSNTRSLVYFARAFSEVCTLYPSFREHARLHLAGVYSRETVAQIVESECGQQVVFHGPKSALEANSMCSQADLLLLLQVEMFRRGKDCCTATPGKLFNYLRSGTPILAPMQESDATETIRNLDAGIVTAPRDVAAIAVALSRRYEAWKLGGDASKTACLKRSIIEYDRKRQTAVLADLVREAVEASG